MDSLIKEWTINEYDTDNVITAVPEFARFAMTHMYIPLETMTIASTVIMRHLLGNSPMIMSGRMTTNCKH